MIITRRFVDEDVSWGYLGTWADLNQKCFGDGVELKAVVSAEQSRELHRTFPVLPASEVEPDGIVRRWRSLSIEVA